MPGAVEAVWYWAVNGGHQIQDLMGPRNRSALPPATARYSALSGFLLAMRANWMSVQPALRALTAVTATTRECASRSHAGEY